MIERGELNIDLRREIGQEGHNSRTYEAFDPQLNALIVVKKIPYNSFTDVGEYFSEAQRLYDTRHPHVVPIHFACRGPDAVWLAMPRYTGSVHAILTRQNLTVREIVKYGLGFLSGLHHVHARRLVHLDVKPSNVLIDEGDRAALADFGLAQRVDGHGLAEQEVMYRTHRAPETLTGSKVGMPVDIYQAGLTLYRMAVGVSCLENQWAKFGTDDQAAYRAVLRGELPDRSNGIFPAHIPPNLRRLIRRALEVDPDARFATILELMGELAKVDGYLDWRYDHNGAGTEVWTRRAFDREHVIRLEHDGTTVRRVIVKTRRLDTNSERMRHKCGGTSSNRSAAVRLVRSAMEELQ